jgi:hypothetical protein
MVNVTYTPTSSDMLYYQDDGTEVIYNLGDIAWSESFDPIVYSLDRDETRRDPLTTSPRVHGSRLAHDSRCGLLLLWSTQKEERLVNAVPLFSRNQCRHHPMGRMGILVSNLNRGPRQPTDHQPGIQ